MEILHCHFPLLTCHRQVVPSHAPRQFGTGGAVEMEKGGSGPSTGHSLMAERVAGRGQAYPLKPKKQGLNGAPNVFANAENVRTKPTQLVESIACSTKATRSSPIRSGGVIRKRGLPASSRNDTWLHCGMSSCPEERNSTASARSRYRRAESLKSAVGLVQDGVGRGRGEGTGGRCSIPELHARRRCFWQMRALCGCAAWLQRACPGGCGPRETSPRSRSEEAGAVGSGGGVALGRDGDGVVLGLAVAGGPSAVQKPVRTG